MAQHVRASEKKDDPDSGRRVQSSESLGVGESHAGASVPHDGPMGDCAQGQSAVGSVTQDYRRMLEGDQDAYRRIMGYFWDKLVPKAQGVIKPPVRHLLDPQDAVLSAFEALGLSFNAKPQASATTM